MSELSLISVAKCAFYRDQQQYNAVQCLPLSKLLLLFHKQKTPEIRVHFHIENTSIRCEKDGFKISHLKFWNTTNVVYTIYGRFNYYIRELISI